MLKKERMTDIQKLKATYNDYEEYTKARDNMHKLHEVLMEAMN